MAHFFSDLTYEHLYFLHNNTYLFAYSFFLDNALDSPRFNPEQTVRATQISSYLLLRYFERIDELNSQKIISKFYRFYLDNTNYLILEKKWEFPQIYLSAYHSQNRIIDKAILLLFPLELCDNNFFCCTTSDLKKLFINYLSFILLADDIIDLDLDIKNRCLTYPIMMYLKLKGKLPQTYTEMLNVFPQIIKILGYFLSNTIKFQITVGRQSPLITATISKISKQLQTNGIKL